MNYRATQRPDGELIVHGVPIFVECERERANGEVFQFDREWITVAVHKAKQAESEGYLPPLHIRHHDPESDSAVRASGYFRITGTQTIRFKGSDKLAILADLHITDPQSREDVLAKRLPYRSVEIFNVEQPAINSLALLDHEPPYLELPMLMVSGVGAVASATFAARKAGKRKENDTFRAAMSDSNGIALQAEMNDDDTKTEDEVPAVKPEGEEQQKVEPTDGKLPESNEPIDGDAVVKAISEGSISVATMEAIVAAIKARTSPEPQGEDMEKEEPKVEAPAPMDERMSAIASENEVLKAKIAAMEADRETDADVSEAMTALAGRPLGSDIRERLVTFRKTYGGAAFKAHVAALQNVAAPAAKATHAERFAAAGGNTIDPIAMKYQDKGADAVERAQKFFNEHKALVAAGGTRLSASRYVELNMAKTNA